MFDKEYIISSAIHYSKGNGRVPFHSVYGIADGVVVCGFRHPHCIQAAKPWIKKGYKEVEQGFITSRGRFVDRYEAARIAVNAGQVHEECGFLYSEDVFPEQDNYGDIDKTYHEDWPVDK